MFSLAKLKLNRDRLFSNTWGEISIREINEDVGTRTNGHKLLMNKFSPEIRRKHLTLKAIRFWNSLSAGAERTWNHLKDLLQNGLQYV